MDLMIEDNGGDRLADLKRGKLCHTHLYAEIGKSQVNLPTFFKVKSFRANSNLSNFVFQEICSL